MPERNLGPKFTQSRRSSNTYAAMSEYYRLIRTLPQLSPKLTLAQKTGRFQPHELQSHPKIPVVANGEIIWEPVASQN